MDLSFIISAGRRQRSHSQVRVLQDSWPYFTLPDSRLPQPGGPGPHIYIPQEQVGPVIPPGNGFPFRRPLLLTGLRWKYSTPPSHGEGNLWLTTRLLTPRERLSSAESVNISTLYAFPTRRDAWNVSQPLRDSHSHSRNHCSKWNPESRELPLSLELKLGREITSLAVSWMELGSG
jgi:hypothetical protein